VAARVLGAVGALLFLVGSVSAFRVQEPQTHRYDLPPVAWLAVARAPDFDPKSLAELPPFEQHVLADGRVSPHEYHQAALRMTACFDRAGLESALTHEHGTWVYEYGGRGRPGESERSVHARIDRVHAHCYSTYFNRVSLWWDAQRSEATRRA
jgi:hypothetical protein